MRPVKYANFHQTVFVPGVGSLGNTLPSQSKSMDLQMFHTPEGLLVLVKTRQFPKGEEALIPWANVVIATLGPDEKKSNLKPVA